MKVLVVVEFARNEQWKDFQGLQVWVLMFCQSLSAVDKNKIQGVITP